MSDIKLVIKIPEEIYNYMQSESYDEHLDRRFNFQVRDAIKNGTPLPKGYGKLIILSEDAVKKEQRAVNFSCQKWISEIGLSNATVAIIGANKAESEVE